MSRTETGEGHGTGRRTLAPGMRLNPVGGLDIPTEPWVDDALCSQVDSEIFFPEKGGSTREAKRICGMCPAEDECLEYAMARDERFGIWGGKSERERRRMKRAAA